MQWCDQYTATVLSERCCVHWFGGFLCESNIERVPGSSVDTRHTRICTERGYSYPAVAI